MKKKILFLALVVVFIVVLSCALVACGGGGGNKTKKTEQNLEVGIANSLLTVKDGEIVLKEDATIRLQKADFTVEIVYSDGSKQAITDYTFDASGVMYTTPGSYTVVFSYNSLIYNISVRIEEGDYEELPSIPGTVDAPLTVTYSGTQYNVVDLVDEEMTGTTLSELIAGGKVSLSTLEVFSGTATSVGDYQMGLVAAKGYGWKADGYKQTEVTVYWKIEKKVLQLPTITGETTFTYDGTEKSVTVDTHGYDDVWTFSYGGNDTRKATNATLAPQEVQAIMVEEKRSNYCVVWMNEKTSDGAYAIGTITVMPMSIARPELLVEASDKVVDPETGSTTYYYDYTGETINVETNMDEYDFYLIEKGIIRDAGTYSVTFSFDSNNYDGNNYKWTGANGTLSSESYVSLTVIVRKATYAIPVQYAEYEWAMEGEYVSGVLFANAYANGFLWFTDETVDWLVESDTWLDDSRLEYNDDEEISFAAGEITLSYNFYRNDNYEPIAISVIASVEKAKQVVDIAWEPVIRQSVGTTYHTILPGENVRYAEYQGNPIDQAGYVYVATVTGAGYNTTPTYMYYYKATQADEYEQVNTVIKPGFYKTVFTLVSDDPNVMLVDDNEVEWEPLVAEWEMEKAPIYLGGYSSGTFGVYDYNAKTYYSFRTGTAKTYTFDNEYVTVTYHWYDGNSPMGWSSNFSPDSDLYIDMADYVQVANPMTYELFVWNNGTWDDAQEAVEVGRYKWVPTGVTLLNGLDEYFELIVPEFEFLILDTTVDATAMHWVNDGSYVYGEGIPYVADAPLGLHPAYVDGTDPSIGPNQSVGSHTMQVKFNNTGADGENLISVTYPVGWNDTAAYTITKKTISSADFVLSIDGNVYDGNGIVCDDNYHYASVDNPFDSYLFSVNVTDMSREWDQGAQIYAGIGRKEVGTYSYTVWITIRSTSANYEFDLSDPNLEEVTSFTPDSSDPSIFIVPIYEGTEQIEVSVDYPYILKLTFSWNIVEGE